MPLLDPQQLRDGIKAARANKIPLARIAGLADVSRSDLSGFANGDRWGSERLGRVAEALKSLGYLPQPAASPAPEAPTPAPAAATPAAPAEEALRGTEAPPIDAGTVRQALDTHLDTASESLTALATRAGLRHQDLSRLRDGKGIPEEKLKKLWAAIGGAP